MFFATGNVTIGPAAMRSHMSVDRKVRLFAVERRRTAHDTRALRCARGPARDVSLIWFVLSGSITWHGASKGKIEGRSAIALRESSFDGANGKRDVSFRSLGEPFRALEIRVDGQLAGAKARATAPVRLDVDEALFAEVEQYVDRALGTDGASTAEAIALLEALTKSELLAKNTVDRAVVTDEDPRLVALWQELASAYARGDTRPSLKRMAIASALSPRTLSRLVLLLAHDLLLPSGGWRETTGQLRMTMAALFLSCPQITVGEVAKALGYGHPEAMANAFQRAGLGTPTDVRNATQVDPDQ